LRAVYRTPASQDLAFALRRVLFADPHADVRAAAARRLGNLRDHADASWLVDALVDHSPNVRDAAVRALAELADPNTRDAIREVALGDRVWWVRRAAVYALAAVGEPATTFETILDDPFWRVRHAAVRVLAVLGAGDLEVRAQIATRSSPARDYLRAAWGPVAVEQPGRVASGTSALPAELLDPDPAVATARLADARDVSPLALVELLCDPHAPLRLLAAERVAESRDPEALRAALDWLEVPRVPHVADLVEEMLDGLADPSLAEFALSRAERRGAVRWAIRWVAATGYDPLAAAALACARGELRRDAVKLASTDELVAWWHDDRANAIALALYARHAFDALLALDDPPHQTRALQADAAAKLADWARVERAFADPHHAPRAVAANALVRAKREVALGVDRDPAVREAALTPHNAAQLAGDVDPFVARAATAFIAAHYRVAHALPDDVATAVRRALDHADPQVRADALRVPLLADGALARAIELLGDPDDAVRASALDALERTSDVDARLAALPSTSMIRAWLTHEAPPLAPVIEAIERPREVASVGKRAFGRAGFDVAPLAVSGAFELPQPAMMRAADAGVELWFWEPAYGQLTKFLRTRAQTTRVIAGSYHADAASIEADVDRALRELRRDRIDALLLFWSRSPARVDARAYAAIEHLKASGKVGALGFSTHDRVLAANAIGESPWDVVMIRHSAAHPGIETALLPVARERGTAIVTFSALCYGRMLTGDNAPAAADCYRYSLSQPGVTACISAPRRERELAENLDVLARPLLDDAQLAAMRTHGIGVRAENQRFNALMRQPTRDAAAAAREMLAAELPPGADVVETRALPRSSTSKPARTRLHRARRR
jgi:diketogulonate reductase-like aldo/keto reductase